MVVLHHLHQKKQIHQVHKPSLSALALLLVMPSSGTSNFNRRGIMKKSILIVLASILLSYPMNLLGGDFETPHEFKSGDIISAEMMNEIFDYINNTNKMITASELIGTWDCSLYTMPGECGVANQFLVKKWDNDTDSLYLHKTDNITFIEDVDGAGVKDGTYSYTTPLPNMFRCADAQHGGFGKWIVKNNVLFMVVNADQVAGDPSNVNAVKLVNLKKVSNTKLLMEIDDTKTVFAECDKQNLPPIAPTLDNVTASGKTVSLAWTDNSTDETGFKVLRKDSLTGSYSTITTTSADATSYSDTVTAAGSYWYRVSATNINGDSVASKMVKVDVE